MFVNKMPRYEILSEDAMAVLDRGWRRIATEIGIEFLLDEAVRRTEEAYGVEVPVVSATKACRLSAASRV